MKNNIFLIIALSVCSFFVNAQDLNNKITTTKELTNKKGSEYKFTVVKNLDANAVQNQGMTGTCWSFSGLSFFESELIRMGKGKDFNLAEMFVARQAYPMKADNYIRMHGKNNMGEGGGFPDVINILRNYGMVPEEVYAGKKDLSAKHNHHQLEAALISVVKSTADNDKIDFEAAHKSIESICDAFLGEVPEKFEYKGKSYTPRTYADATGLKADDYVFITSFTHHPFYTKFTLEVPDNWNWEQMYNVPLSDLKEIMSSAIQNGYTFGWAADVSEKGFMFKDGIAVMPQGNMDEMKPDERKELAIKPHPQLVVTQEMRQKAFDNYETQDDHGMHVVGLVKDQTGTPFYIVKNSWGTDHNECDGYFYASESYLLYKTTNIVLNKKAIPPAIAKKLGITQ